MRLTPGNESSAPEVMPSLQLVSELAGLLSWEYDTAAQTFCWSPNAERMLGAEPPRTLPEFIQSVHPDDQDKVQAAFQRWIDQGLGFDIEHRVVNAEDDNVAWLRSRGASFPDHEQSGNRLLGIAQDITEYKLHQSNASFLADMQNRLAFTSSTDESLDATGEKILAYLRLSRLTVHTIEGGSDQATLLFEHRRDGVDGADPELDLAAHFPPALGEKLSRGEHVVIARSASSNGAGHSAMGTSGAQSSIYFPHFIEGQWSMMLGAHHERPHTWDHEEIELLREITERLCLRLTHTRIEQDLRQSEYHYRTLFESIDEGFCVIEVLLDDDGKPDDYRFLEVNPAFVHHTGLTDAVGQRMRQMAPDHESYWFETYGKVALTGEPSRFVHEARALGNRWFDVHAFRVGDPALHRVAVLFTDITNRKRTEDMLRESEERVHRAIEIDSVGIIFFQPEGLVTYANQAFLRMSGYSREDVMNGLVRWDTMTPAEWMPSARRAIDEFLSLGRIAPYEKEYVRKDGSRWWGLFAASRISEDEGVKFIIDITRSKQAEVERARLAEIVEDSNDAIIRCGPDGTIVDVNHAATELYNSPARELIGKNVMETSPEDRRHEFPENYARLLCGEQVPPWETVRHRSDGSEIQVEIRMSPIRDVRGAIIGCSGIVRDVTERKRLEQAQEDFLAMASHDLRSPVTVLLGRAQLMRRRKAYDDASIRTIIDQARRIERLTTDLQQVVHLESGQLELNPTRIDLASLATEAVDRIRISAPGFELKLDTPGEPVIGEWDRNRLNQVLDNLLLNAVKYSPDGGCITVQVSADENTAELRVSDHGVGITQELQKRLFTRFYRADEAGVASGLGLGLYISRMLVEAHGGTIRVDSRPAAGSVFTVNVPRQFPRD